MLSPFYERVTETKSVQVGNGANAELALLLGLQPSRIVSYPWDPLHHHNYMIKKRTKISLIFSINN